MWALAWVTTSSPGNYKTRLILYFKENGNMSNYSSLKTTINANVKTNGNQEITGSVMNTVLLQMVDILGAGFQYMGVANESTNPGTPDNRVAYLAGPGSYPRFGNAFIPSECVGVFTYDGEWRLQTTDIGRMNLTPVSFLNNQLYYHYVLPSTLWSDNGYHRHIAVPVTAGKQYKIEGGSETTTFAWLTTHPATNTGGTQAPVVSGTTVTTIPAGGTIFVEAPATANFMCIRSGNTNTGTGREALPAAIYLAESELDDLRSDLDTLSDQVSTGFADLSQDINGLDTRLISVETFLAAGYLYKGLADPATNPGTPSGKVFYLASTPGSYPRFGSVVVAEDEVAVLRFDGSSWHKDESGIAPAEAMRRVKAITSEKELGTTRFTRTPSTSTTSSTFPAYPMKAGRSYHFKIEPNGYTVYPTQTYSFVLRAMLTDSISGADDPNIVAVLLMMSRTDYTGRTIEFDYYAKDDSEYLQIYIARASSAGTGVVITVTESEYVLKTDKTLLVEDMAADAKVVGDILIPIRDSGIFTKPVTTFTRIPSTTATTSTFPAFKMRSGRTYHFKIEPNGYTVYNSTYNYSFVIRATLTPSISGADDPNIVAVLLMMSRTDYTGDVIEFDYTAEADSEYLQLYIARAGNPGTGVVYTITEQIFILEVDKTLTEDNIPADARATGAAIRGDVGDYVYFGRKLDLYTHRYTLEQIMALSRTGNQGADIADGILFQAFDGGACYAYDFAAGNPVSIGNFTFACASPDNHFNCVNFGDTVPSGCTYPALYISTGKANSPVDFVCHVEGITRSGDTFSSVLIQTITLDISGWAAAGYMPIWGAPHWMVDKERGFLWVFSAKLRTTQQYTGNFKNNRYIATQFKIPALSGDVTLTADDILRQVIFDFDTYFTQGGTMKDGKIYYCFGLGQDAVNPANVRVFDTDDGSVCTRFNMRYALPYEPEDMIVRDNRLMLITNSGVVYEIK